MEFEEPCARNLGQIPNILHIIEPKVKVKKYFSGAFSVVYTKPSPTQIFEPASILCSLMDELNEYLMNVYPLHILCLSHVFNFGEL